MVDHFFSVKQIYLYASVALKGEIMFRHENDCYLKNERFSFKLNVDKSNTNKVIYIDLRNFLQQYIDRKKHEYGLHLSNDSKKKIKVLL